jgi:hypothetical protein
MKPADKISKSFCVMPWVGVATDPRGGIYPCCWMDRSKEGKFHGEFKDYENSDFLNSLKQDFLEGKYPSSCKKCEWNDKSGLISKRLRENDRWFAKHTEEEMYDDKFEVVDLRLSNKCNLSCVICWPGDSSAIFEETKKHYHNTLDHYKSSMDTVGNLNLTNPYSTEDIDFLVSKIKPTSRVYFTGGEPSLVKSAFDVLDKLVDMGYNKTVQLEFNSNFQALNQKWFDKLKQFKGSMLVSIDAIGPQAELVRYGTTWESVDRNVRTFLKECPNFNVIISPTPSILNVFYLKDIIKWKDDLGYKDKVSLTFQNRLYTPSYLDMKNLPEELKPKAIQYVSEIDTGFFRQDLVKHLNQKTNIIAWNAFISNMDRLDAIRGTKWREVLAELNYTNIL